MTAELVQSRSSYGASLFLHAALILLAAFGLPMLLPKAPDPQPMVMTIEVLPITGVTNIKPSDQPITEEKKTKAPETKKPVTEAAKEPPKPVQKTEAAPPKPVTQPKEAEALPNAKPQPKKEEPKQDDFDKLMNNYKQQEKTTQQTQALLNKLQQEAKKNQKEAAKDTTDTPENKTKSDAPYDPGLPLSLSEKDAISGQIHEKWSGSSFMGGKNADSLIVRLHLVLGPDGTVQTAELADDQRGRYASDPFFRAAAEAALRAVHMASPLKNLPADKYNTWHDFTLNFNPV